MEITSKPYLSLYDETELCDKSASTHFKAVIQIRNQTMIDRADLVIAYVERETGGAAQTLSYAVQNGKPVINLAVVGKEK